MSEYDLNESLPSHAIEEYDQLAPLSQHNNNNKEHHDHYHHHMTRNNKNNYNSTYDGGHNNNNNNNKYTTLTHEHPAGSSMGDDDNKSMLSKLIERSKLISEVLSATYGKPSTYARYAKETTKYGGEGVDDETKSVMMQ
eukprot:196824_1